MNKIQEEIITPDENGKEIEIWYNNGHRMKNAVISKKEMSYKKFEVYKSEAELKGIGFLIIKEQ